MLCPKLQEEQDLEEAKQRCARKSTAGQVQNPEPRKTLRRYRPWQRSKGVRIREQIIPKRSPSGVMSAEQLTLLITARTKTEHEPST